MEAFKTNLVTYQRARPRIANGDLALCRPQPRSIEGGAIIHFSDALKIGRYSHATMLGYAGDCLMIGETRETNGARLIAASAEIRRWPCFYDVFRVREDRYPQFDGDEAWSRMCRAAGAGYGFRHLWRIWLRRRLPFGYLFFPPVRNSEDPQAMRVCSELVQYALRGANGPIFKRHDADMAPGDISNLEHVRYRFTLTWDEDEQDACMAETAQAKGLVLHRNPHNPLIHLFQDGG